MTPDQLALLGSLVTALAWPIATLALALAFKSELRALLSRVKSLSVGSLDLVIQTVEAEVEKLADHVDKIGHLPPAAQAPMIAALSKQVVGARRQDVREVYVQLVQEYVSRRAARPKNPDRTRAMELVAAKMRAFAPGGLQLLPDLASSGEAGQRLAATTVLQVCPRASFMGWLGDRFGNEAPFVEYHAALALLSIARMVEAEDRHRLVGIVKRALLHCPEDAKDRRAVLTDAASELDWHPPRPVSLPRAG